MYRKWLVCQHFTGIHLASELSVKNVKCLKGEPFFGWYGFLKLFLTYSMDAALWKGSIKI